MNENKKFERFRHVSREADNWTSRDDEVQGNYPNFKKKLAEKENFVVKSQRKPAAF